MEFENQAITTLCWIPKGAAAEYPVHQELSAEEVKQLKEEVVGDEG